MIPDRRPPALAGQGGVHRGGRRDLRRGQQRDRDLRRRRRGLHRVGRDRRPAPGRGRRHRGARPARRGPANLDEFLDRLQAQVEAGEKIALANERGSDTAQFETELDNAQAETLTAAEAYGFTECGQEPSASGTSTTGTGVASPDTSVTPAPVEPDTTGGGVGDTGGDTGGGTGGGGVGPGGGVSPARRPRRRRLAKRPPGPPRCRTARRSGRRPRSARRGCRSRRCAPFSSTAIRSAPRIVESRCAITIAVRPASSRSSPVSIARSVRTSTFEVASSRIRIRGSASSARANAISCRWPAESETPRSPTSVSKPSGSRLMNSPAPIASAAASISSSRGVRAARRRCSRGRCPRTGSPPGARSRAGCAGTAPSGRAGRARRPAPGRAAGRRSARPASRRCSCRRRSRRPAPASRPAGTWIETSRSAQSPPSSSIATARPRRP